MKHSLTATLWNGVDYRALSTLDWHDDGIDGEIDAVRTGDAGTGIRMPGETGDYSIIPGLIDTHVHLVGNAAATPADFLTWPLTTRPEEQTLHGLAHAVEAMQGGVTTVRDLAADDIQFSLRRAIDAAVVTGPRMLAYGVVNMTAGHSDLFIPPAVALRKPVADGPDACRALVRHWARSGTDGIKIPVSGGVLSVGDKSAWRNYTRAEIAAIVDEAHAFGMLVAAHAHTEAGIQVALEEGIDSIEHGTLMSAHQATAIAAKGLTVAPTLLINERIAAGQNGVSPAQSEKAQELVANRNRLMRVAADAGVDFVLGTDANGHHVKFGDQMEEVRLMAAIFGWSAERALQAATSRAASAIGRASTVGTLAEGRPADFLVMRGRPWQNIDDLRLENLVAVVSRGRVVAGALPAE
ncbi:amidohydrolase family protein [Subtercola sp. YIM 133946]|uniref:amidohydrolase family protein n=1 Tax=Subtercola sp. YIM 133946 TaxID=3118909 RepID=UPI002F933657